MCEVFRNALKYILVAKWVFEFSMAACSKEDSPMLKGLNKVLLCKSQEGGSRFIA